MANDSMLAAALKRAGFTRSHEPERLFEVKDPLGATIVCALDTWEGHIERFHAEMIGNVEAVQKVIAKPSQITRSATSKTELCYYGDAPASFGGRMIKVVATVKSGKKRGYVNTAHAWTQDIPDSERQFWPPLEEKA